MRVAGPAGYVDTGRPGVASSRAAAARPARQEQRVFRYLAGRPGRETTGRAVGVARIVDVIRALGIAVVLVTVSLAKPHPGAPGGRGTAIAVTLACSAVAWLAWMFARGNYRLTVAALTVMAVAGGALAGLSPLVPPCPLTSRWVSPRGPSPRFSPPD
jgi:hypothetical protein